MQTQCIKLLLLFLFTFLFVTPVFANNAHEPWQGAYTEGEFAGGEIRQAYCDMVGLVEGNFGGLLFSVAGVVALAFAAFGMSQHSKTAVAAGIGAFAISAAVSLYFGDLGCGNGGNGTARTAKLNNISSSPTDRSERAYKSFLDSQNKISNEGSEYSEYYEDESQELF